MVGQINRRSISAADEVAAAEANLKAAQERLNAARQCYAQEAYGVNSSAAQPAQQPAHDTFAHTPVASFSGSYDASAGKQQIKPVKDHIAAGILAIFFGVLGIHKFYMGFTNTGFLVLAITIIGSLLTFGTAALIMQLIAIVEGIVYLVKTQSQFEQDYVIGKRKWL